MSKEVMVRLGVLCLLIGVIAVVVSRTGDYRGTPDGRDLIIGGAIFVALGVLLFAFASGKPSRRMCPHCSGVTHTRATREEAKDYRGLFGFGPFFPVLKCQDCGRVWEPPLPREVLVVGFGTGVLCLLFGILAFVGALGAFGPQYGGEHALALCLVTTAYGLAATVGCAKRMAKSRSHSELKDRRS